MLGGFFLLAVVVKNNPTNQGGGTGFEPAISGATIQRFNQAKLTVPPRKTI